VVWVVETTGLAVIHRGADTRRWLPCPEAAAWDLLSRGYSHEAVTAALCAIASLPRAEAEARLQAMIGSWVEAGLLVEAADRG
jgi:hypothetical protein